MTRIETLVMSPMPPFDLGGMLNVVSQKQEVTLRTRSAAAGIESIDEEEGDFEGMAAAITDQRGLPPTTARVSKHDR